VVDDPGPETRAQLCFRNRHTQSIGNALTKGTRGRLDAGSRIVFGMPGTVRAKLAEGPHLRKRDLLVTCQMEERIEQHRSVAVRDDETVTVWPERILRIEFQVAREQRGRDLRHAERNPLMALASIQDRINSKKADRIGLSISDLA